MKKVFIFSFLAVILFASSIAFAGDTQNVVKTKTDKASEQMKSCPPGCKKPCCADKAKKAECKSDKKACCKDKAKCKDKTKCKSEMKTKCKDKTKCKSEMKAKCKDKTKCKSEMKAKCGPDCKKPCCAGKKK